MAENGRTETSLDLAKLASVLPPSGRFQLKKMRAILWYEAILRAYWPVISALLIFLGVTVWGAWAFLPNSFHILGLVIFAVSLAAFAWRGARRFQRPSDAEVLTRLEMASRLTGSPLHSLADDLVKFGANYAEVQGVWQVWRQRLVQRLGVLKTGYPVIGLADQDPYALRFIPVLVLAAGGILFAHDLPNRFEAVATFDFAEPQPLEIAAWIEAPLYTNRGLIPLHIQDGTERLSVPAGSQLHIQVSGSSKVSARFGEVVLQNELSDAAASQKRYQTSLALDAGLSDLKLFDEESQLASWPLFVVADQPPKISFSQSPSFAPSGALRLEYDVQDDYPGVEARAVFSTSERLEPYMLVPPPEFDLVLPSSEGGQGRTFKDISASPWAGEILSLDLVAVDAADQMAAAQEKVISIPRRNFTNPFAARLVDLRQRLALDRRQETAVIVGLGYVLQDMAQEDVGIFLYTTVNRAMWQLKLAREDASRLEALDLMWQAALELEGEAGALAAEAMRQAQEDLREALRNGASPEEIAQKVEALKKAIAEYLAAMNLQNLPPEAMTQSPNAEVRDLADMLNSMQTMAEMGAREAAETLLNELENMLENLQAMQNPSQQQPSEAMKALEDLQRLMREQGNLRDQTYRQDQLQEGDVDEATRQDLAQEQAELEKLLQELMEKMQKMEEQQGQNQQGQNQQGQGEQGQDGQQGQEEANGAPAQGEGEGAQTPGQSGQPQPGQGQNNESVAERLQRALEAMRQAQGQLQGGNFPGAGQSQNDVLQALRQAGQGFLENMARNQGQGQGQQGAQGFQPGNSFGQRGRDPLGRNEGGANNSGVKIPSESEAARIREILRQLQDRLSEPNLSPQDENYLERLLDY